MNLKVNVLVDGGVVTVKPIRFKAPEIVSFATAMFVNIICVEFWFNIEPPDPEKATVVSFEN